MHIIYLFISVLQRIAIPFIDGAVYYQRNLNISFAFYLKDQNWSDFCEQPGTIIVLRVSNCCDKLYGKIWMDIRHGYRGVMYVQENLGPNHIDNKLVDFLITRSDIEVDSYL